MVVLKCGATRDLHIGGCVDAKMEGKESGVAPPLVIASEKRVPIDASLSILGLVSL